MVAVTGKQAQSLISRPDRKFWAYLIHGPDAGLVAERASNLSLAIARSLDPPGETMRLDDADIEADPDRLAVELLTAPMFGGRKIIRVTASRRINIHKLKPIVQETHAAGFLIVEAGQIKKTDALHALFEKLAHAATIACYVDDVETLGELIDETLRREQLSLAPAVRQTLISRLGGDRVMSRSELNKLAIYAAGQGQISEDDVDAVIGDASELTIDRIVHAAAMGEATKAVEEYNRALSSGEDAQSIILSLQRHLIRLHGLAVAIAAGRSVEAVIGDLKPKPPPKVQDVLKDQCRRWRLPALGRALEATADAARKARWMPAQQDLIAERLMLQIAQLASARKS